MSGLSEQVADLERGGPARGAPAQQGPDPRQQLLALERLDQVVVGAAVEAGDAVLGLGAGGQHQDRHVAVGAQPAADLDAVEAREPEVEDDEVGDEAGGDVERLDAVGRGAHLVALVAQRAAQDVGDVGVVLDDQHAAADLDSVSVSIGAMLAGADASVRAVVLGANLWRTAERRGRRPASNRVAMFVRKKRGAPARGSKGAESESRKPQVPGRTCRGGLRAAPPRPDRPASWSPPASTWSSSSSSAGRGARSATASKPGSDYLFGKVGARICDRC